MLLINCCYMFIIYSIVKNKIKIRHRLVSKVLELTIKCKENDNVAKNVLSYRILFFKHFETKHLRFVCNIPQERHTCRYIAISL